jgi:hypothetical protein
MFETKGYNSIILFNKGIGKQRRVDELVYETFIGEEKLDILMHKDGNCLNDEVSNLEQVTFEEYLHKSFGDEWRSLPDYPSYYISKDARIWSSKTNIILRQQFNAGYMSVTIGYPKSHFEHMHRLVAKAFCENKDNFNIVNHKDGNLQNTHADNLEWVSAPKHTYNRLTNKQTETDILMEEKHDINEILIEIESVPEYAISENGRVYSMKSKKFMKPSLSDNGYMRVTCIVDGGYKKLAVHRLVAEVYLDCPEILEIQVNHKDSNRQNNHYTNLEWCTQSENIKHRNGPDNKIFKHLRKSIVQMDLNGVQIKIFDGIKEASRELNINSGSIVKVCKNIRPTAGGFKWKYLE